MGLKVLADSIKCILYKVIKNMLNYGDIGYVFHLRRTYQNKIIV